MSISFSRWIDLAIGFVSNGLRVAAGMVLLFESVRISEAIPASKLDKFSGLAGLITRYPRNPLLDDYFIIFDFKLLLICLC